jgi:hypothetical protein
MPPLLMTNDNQKGVTAVQANQKIASILVTRRTVSLHQSKAQFLSTADWENKVLVMGLQFLPRNFAEDRR